MSESLPTLYKRTTSLAIQEWTVAVTEGGYFVRSGQTGGKIKESALHGCEAKNVGRANETTVAAQAKIEAEALWLKKQKEGYTPDINAIDDQTFKRPMKGDPFDKRYKEIVYPCIIQDKLNGIRCQSEADRSYSTGGETFHTIPHIRAALKPLFDKYPNLFIDGELFNYELRRNLNRLVKLVSVVYQPKDITPELLAESAKIVQLHVFDGYGFDNITMDTPYIDRMNAVAHLLYQRVPELFIKAVAFRTVRNEEELMAAFLKTKDDGGEGIMIRHGACPFKHTRVPYLIKLKHMMEEEFTIFDIQEGNGDWKGRAKRMVLKIKNQAGAEVCFDSNIDGDMGHLKEIFEHRAEHIGKKATCRFQHKSEYGIPQLPWVSAIRDYE